MGTFLRGLGRIIFVIIGIFFAGIVIVPGAFALIWILYLCVIAIGYLIILYGVFEMVFQKIKSYITPTKESSVFAIVITFPPIIYCWKIIFDFFLRITPLLNFVFSFIATSITAVVLIWYLEKNKEKIESSQTPAPAIIIAVCAIFALVLVFLNFDNLIFLISVGFSFMFLSTLFYIKNSSDFLENSIALFFSIVSITVFGKDGEQPAYLEQIISLLLFTFMAITLHLFINKKILQVENQKSS